MQPKLFEFNGQIYPDYIKHGQAARFILPFAIQFCHGSGLDVGGTQECHFPGARIVNSELCDGYDAYHLPDGTFDFIFSSHTLEHLVRPFNALEEWISRIKPGGCLFLYLPHPDMSYWHPRYCLKHINSFTPLQISEILALFRLSDIIYSKRDLYWSFSAVGFKPSMTELHSATLAG